MEKGKVTWQLVLFQNCFLWWPLVSEKDGAHLCLPVAWGRWHVRSHTMNRLKLQRLCWGTGSTSSCLQPSCGLRCLVRLISWSWRRWTRGLAWAASITWLRVIHVSALCLTDGLPACLVIAQSISCSKSLMLRGLWQSVRPMKCFFLNVSQLWALGGSQR